jgi:nucleoid DNA-binding protein
MMVTVMNRLIRRLSAASEIAPAKAADQIDEIVHNIVEKLRRGESASVPGLGKFIPGPTPAFRPENELEIRHEKTKKPIVRRTPRSGR